MERFETMKEEPAVDRPHLDLYEIWDASYILEHVSEMPGRDWTDALVHVIEC